MEPRAYLSGAVFGGTPVTTPAASLNSAPVYSDLVDVNGDGKADLVAASAASGNIGNSISISLGNGDGTFTASQSFALPFAPLTIVDGQLGNNGKNDIVVGSTNSDQFVVLLQDNVGAFTAHTLTAPLLTNTQSVTIGNFGNGAQDIAVASIDAGTTNNVAIFSNDGAGNFGLTQTLSVPFTHLASITSFAATNNVADLAVADSSDNSVTVLTNDGTGTFSVGNTYSVGAEPVTIKAGTFNMNHDNNQDLVTANLADGSVSVLLGNGDGTFQPTAVTTSAGGQLLKVRVSNLNSDNVPDLLGLLSNGSTSQGEVLLGDGDGTFHVGSTIPSTSSTLYTSISAGNLNTTDSLTDLVLANASTVTAFVNTTAQDITAPTAAMAAPQPPQSVGASTVTFSVTYTDAQQVDASTINSTNVTVTDPNGASRPVTLVSSGLANGPSVTAIYSVPATNGSLGVDDNGTYTVTVNPSGLVTNANAVPEATGTIGTFNVAVSTNGPDLVAGQVKVRLKPAVVAGTRSGTAETVTVVNQGNQAAKGKIGISLFASPTQNVLNGTSPLLTVFRQVNIKANGGRAVIVLPGFTWPASVVGTEFLVAQVNTTQSITETTYNNNFGISATSTVVAAPFFDVQNLWTGKLPATLKVGRRALIPVILKNVGNSVARGTATVTVQAVPVGGGAGTTLATLMPRLNVRANGRQAIGAAVTIPNTLTSGQYNIAITVSLAGDTNSTNDTVTSTGTFTV
jgi:hypothetical protein